MRTPLGSSKRVARSRTHSSPACDPSGVTLTFWDPAADAAATTARKIALAVKCFMAPPVNASRRNVSRSCRKCSRAVGLLAGRSWLEIADPGHDVAASSGVRRPRGSSRAPRATGRLSWEFRHEAIFLAQCEPLRSVRAVAVLVARRALQRRQRQLAVDALVARGRRLVGPLTLAHRVVPFRPLPVDDPEPGRLAVVVDHDLLLRLSPPAFAQPLGGPLAVVLGQSSRCSVVSRTLRRCWPHSSPRRSTATAGCTRKSSMAGGSSPTRRARASGS